MSRFLVLPEHLTPHHFVLTGSEARHAALVLRAKPGEEIDLFDGRDASFLGRIQMITEARVEGEILGPGRDARPAVAATVILAQAMIKGPKWDWLIEKASEIGVHRLIPLHTQRTIVRNEDSRLPHKAERWTRIALASAKQCGRNRPMEIAAPLAWGAFIANLTPGALVLLPWEKELSKTVRDAFRGQIPTATYVLIGPEGGWDPDEVRQAEAVGAVSVRLGPTLLRAETAGLVAATLVLRELGVY